MGCFTCAQGPPGWRLLVKGGDARACGPSRPVPRGTRLRKPHSSAGRHGAWPPTLVRCCAGVNPIVRMPYD